MASDIAKGLNRGENVVDKVDAVIILVRPTSMETAEFDDKSFGSTGPCRYGALAFDTTMFVGNGVSPTKEMVMGALAKRIRELAALVNSLRSQRKE